MADGSVIQGITVKFSADLSSLTDAVTNAKSILSDFSSSVSSISSSTSDALSNAFSGLNNIDVSGVKSEVSDVASELTDLGNDASDAGAKISDATDNAGSHTSSFSNILSGVKDIASNVGSGISSAFSTVASGAFGMATQAVGLLKNELSDSIQVAEVHQGIMAQTTQVVKSTGDASGMTAQAIADLGTSLSHTTTFSNDTIQSGENLLLTFTGIGKDVFPATTKTMLDMAQAMGGDTKGAALMLGKALGDPATGLTALTRVGVTFSDQEKEQIKTMMAHNDVVGAQKIMLKELQTEFGGSAEAAGKTFAGSLQILKNDMMDVKQQIGGALLPVLQAFTGFVTSTAMPILEGFGNWFSSTAGPLLQGFSNNIGKAFTYVGEVLHSLNLSDFNDAWGDVKASIKETGQAFQVLGEKLKPISVDVDPIADAIGTLAHNGLEVLTNILWKAYEGISAVNGIFLGGKGPLEDFGNGIKQIVKAIQPTAAILAGQFKADLKWLGDTFNQIGAWVQSSLMPALATLVPPFMSIANTVATNLLPAFATLYASGHQLVESILTPLIGVLERILPPVISFAGLLAGGLAAGFKVVAPLVKGLADGISGLVNFFTKTELGGDLVKATLIALAVPVSLLGVLLAAMAVGAIADFLATIPAMVTGFQLWAGGAWEAASGTIAATWPILAIIAVIALVILAIQHWGDIVNWLKMAWGAIATFFTGLWKNITSIFTSGWNSASGGVKQGTSSFSSWWTGVWNGIVSAAKVVWDAIANAAKVGAQFIFNWVFGPFMAIGALFVWLYGHNTYFKQLVDAIVDFFKGCFTWLQSAWTATVAWLVGVWTSIAKSASDLWKQVSSAITAAVKIAWDWLVSVWTTISKWLQDQWNTVAKFATDLWNKISTAVHDGWVKAVGFVSDVWSQIAAFFTNAWNNYIVKPLTALWTSVSNVFSSAWNTYIATPLTNLWNSVSKWFTDLGTHALQSGKNFIQMIVDGINSGVGSIWNAVVNIANTIWKALGFHSPAKSGPGADADKWMPNMVGMLSDGLNSGVGKMQSASNNLASSIKNSLGTLASDARGWSVDMINQFVQGILKGVGAVGNAASQIASAISANLHFSKPDVGPLADADKWMPDFGSLLSKGLIANISKIQSATKALATPISVALNPSALNAQLNYASLAGSKAIQAASSAQPIVVQVQQGSIYLDGHEVTNRLAPYIANMIRLKGDVRNR